MIESLIACDFDYLYGYATTAGSCSRGVSRIARRSLYTIIPGTRTLKYN